MSEHQSCCWNHKKISKDSLNIVVGTMQLRSAFLRLRINFKYHKKRIVIPGDAKKTRHFFS